MGISRDSRHKRRNTGGQRKPYRKKRKYEMGRQPSNTKIGPKRVHLVRCMGGIIKKRGLRLETGSFSWGSEAISRKSRIVNCVYNSANVEYVRTNTLTKSAIIQVEAAPFRFWYMQHYGVDLNKIPKAAKVEEKAAKKPKEKAAEKPKEKAAEKPKEKAAAKPKEKAAEKPKEKAAEKPKEKAAAKKEKGEKAAEKPKEKAAAKGKAEKGKTEEKAAKGKGKVAHTLADKAGKVPAKGSKEEKRLRIRQKEAAKRHKETHWIETHTATPGEKKMYAARLLHHTIDAGLAEQFSSGKLLACVTSRPGQIGRCDGYLLEGEELEFYLKKMEKKKKGAAQGK
ncbi:40S ribosomal protein S8 [Pelomyxa schiedti]|nr:40S ribosomal protein S8 [Pelomyxa schiedti]